MKRIISKTGLLTLGGVILMGLMLLTIGLVALVQFGSAPVSPEKISVEQPTKRASVEIPEATKQQVWQAYGRLPLSFEANQGQTDSQVKFLSRGSGYSLFFTSTEAILSLSKPATPTTADAEDSPAIERSVLRMQLVGANPAPQVTGLEELPGKSNYFIGNDPRQWHTDVANYAKVRYKEVYPGVDLLYYGNQGQLEYDFIVAPGANPNVITLGFQGAESLEIDAQGNLILYTEGDEVVQRAPIIYQEINGTKQAISGRYVFKGKHQVGFQVDTYDASKPLLIDPVLVYSTYLGSAEGKSIAVDAEGNAYVTGETFSSNFPTVNPLQPSYGGGYDAFVAKVNAAGSTLVYSTYLGGDKSDESKSIAVDAEGNAYVTGRTNSGNFPTANPLQLFFGQGSYAFAAKLGFGEPVEPYVSAMTKGQTLEKQQLKWLGDYLWYQIPVRSGEHIFVLLDKDSSYRTFLSIKEGGLPETPVPSAYSPHGVSSDHEVELTASGDGYCYVQVMNNSCSGGTFSITAHNESTFPTLTRGQTLENQRVKGDSSLWYQIPVRSGEHIFVLLDKVGNYSTSLYIKEGGLPEREPIGYSYAYSTKLDEIAGLTAIDDGYCYIQVENHSATEGTFSLKILIQDTPLELPLNQAQTIMVSYDNPLWYQLNIPPDTDSLLLTLQKMENAWRSALILQQLEEKVTLSGRMPGQAGGSGDLVLHVKNPPPGIYDVEVTPLESGQGVLTASTEELTPGEWNVRRIYRPRGLDWCQVNVPAGQPSLFIEVEILGTWSRLDVWRDEIGSQEHWRSNAKQVGEENIIELLIPGPAEGTYYLQVMDSATIYGTSFKLADSQERDYMIRADTSRLVPIPIDNEFVKMEVLPERAAVSSLIFRQGSNQELIQSQYDRYLVDLGSEDERLADFLKRNWKLNSQDTHDTYAAFDFSHPTGFRKHLLISWSEKHVEVRCDFTAPEPVVINNNLAPSGTTGDGGDHWAVPNNPDVLTGDFAYPSSYRQVYPATSGEWAMPPGGWISFWDDGGDEVYGFTFSSGYGVQIGEDDTTHFKFTLPAGSSTIAFQVRKPRPDRAYDAIRALGEKPIFTLTIQVDQRFTGANALLTYIIEYANTGPGQATQTMIQNMLPPELSYIDGSATAGGTYDPSTHSLTWNIGVLDADGSAQQVSFRAQVDSSVMDGYDIVNTARIFCDELYTPVESHTIATVATPTITGVSPKEGGNTGTVMVTITGRNLDPAAEVAMVRLGEESIRSTAVSGYSDGTELMAEFDIKDKAEGLWDIIVTNPNGLTSTSEPESANDFEIVPGGSHKLWIEIVGREENRVGCPTTYIIQYGNSGNIDALGVPLWIVIQKMGSQYVTNWELDAEIIPPPPIDWEEIPAHFRTDDIPPPPIDWEEIPVHVETDDEIILPLLVPVIPPGVTRELKLKVTITPPLEPPPPGYEEAPYRASNRVPHVPAVIRGFRSFQAVPADNQFGVQAWFTSPLFHSPLDPKMADCLEQTMTTIASAFVDFIIPGECLDTFEKILGGEAGKAIAKWRLDPETDFYGSLNQYEYGAIEGAFWCMGETLTKGTGIGMVIQTAKFLRGMSSCLEVIWDTLKLLLIKLVFSISPEDKFGPVGYDPDVANPDQRQRFVQGKRTFGYRIDFWNKEDAPAPTQDVFIEDRLDGNLDWNSFEFSDFGFLKWDVSVSPGQKQLDETVDLRPDMSLLVRLQANIDASGMVRWTFNSLDPYTGQPPEDPRAGFLPPITESGYEIGWVNYKVKPKPNLPTGTQISNQAFVKFDVGPWKPAPPNPDSEIPGYGPWVNTIDSGPPTSRVKPLPTSMSSTTFTVQWEGTDDANGAGIRGYTIYVSEDGDIFTEWIFHTTQTSAEFTGELGQTYYFYSRAEDNVGNVEEAPSKADAITTVTTPRWDANQDGEVDILDLVLVGLHFGETIAEPVTPNPDINGDGVVDISDLVLVGLHFGESVEAPAAASLMAKTTPVIVQLQARLSVDLLNVTIQTDSHTDLHGFQFDFGYDNRALKVISVKEGSLLKASNATYWHEPEIDAEAGKIFNAAVTRLLAKDTVRSRKMADINSSGTLSTLTFSVKDERILMQSKLVLSHLKMADSKGRLLPFVIKANGQTVEELIIPEKTKLMQNYPNPFNPETWIPYELAQDASVTISIYDIQGRLVRKFHLGQKPKGAYLTKSRAAYWNGRNTVGEKVASGVYFYTITAGDFTQTRRMFVVK